MTSTGLLRPGVGTVGGILFNRRRTPRGRFSPRFRSPSALNWCRYRRDSWHKKLRLRLSSQLMLDTKRFEDETGAGVPLDYRLYVLFRSRNWFHVIPLATLIKPAAGSNPSWSTWVWKTELSGFQFANHRQPIHNVGVREVMEYIILRIILD